MLIKKKTMTTNNYEAYVSLETAKLLKEAGFNWPCNSIIEILENGEGCFNLVTSFWDWNCGSHGETTISAPTLAVAQRWLREVRGMLVVCTSYRENLQNPFDKWEWDLIPVTGGRIAHGSNCSTYEEALEIGIQKCLNILSEN